LTPRTKHGKMIEIPNGLIVHIMMYKCNRESTKVSRNLAAVKATNPIISDHLTPSLSIKYPEIVKPYANRKRADTQKRTPASCYVILNSYSQ
jgi:hypothetical protein